jgi:hypothetical protein
MGSLLLDILNFSNSNRLIIRAVVGATFGRPGTILGKSPVRVEIAFLKALVYLLSVTFDACT